MSTEHVVTFSADEVIEFLIAHVRASHRVPDGDYQMRMETRVEGGEVHSVKLVFTPVAEGARVSRLSLCPMPR